MTVYVDNSRIPATVGRIKGRWSHLTADTKNELHAFAALIGLQQAWFQIGCKSGMDTVETCVHWHYDVTDSKRSEALAAGAQSMDIRQWASLCRARREQIRAATPRPVNEIDESLSEPGNTVYAPCQPIGCDADFHLPGCVYATVDQEETR